MVKKKYSGETEISDKIDALFTYRKLTDLLARGQINKDRPFIAQLTNLQYQIYLLDAYLEGHWDLDKPQLHKHWTAIQEALLKLQYTPDQIDTMLKEIRKYERIERNCRKDIWPTKEPFETFYTTKSCDVRLIRRLIYAAKPDLQAIWKPKAWEYYDLITEINDDIADFQEDLLTYNGNRFLVSILRKGFEKTMKQYNSYLLKITSKAKAYFKKYRDTGENAVLYNWTMDRSKETLQLLEKTVNEIDHTVITASYLLGKMK